MIQLVSFIKEKERFIFVLIQSNFLFFMKKRKEIYKAT